MDLQGDMIKYTHQIIRSEIPGQMSTAPHLISTAIK